MKQARRYIDPFQFDGVRTLLASRVFTGVVALKRPLRLPRLLDHNAAGPRAARHVPS